MVISKKKIISLVAVGTLVLSMLALAGCGGKDTPKTAKEAFDANTKALESVENYHSDINADIEIGYSMPGAEGSEKDSDSQASSMTMPMSITMSADASKKVVHADLNLKMSLFGESQDMKAEMWSDLKGGKSYVKDSESNAWSVSDESGVDVDKLTKMNVPDEMAEKMTIEEGDGIYTVKCEAKDIDFTKLMKNQDITEDMGSEMGLDFSNMKVESGTIEFIFDSETQLIKEAKVSDLKMVYKAPKGDEENLMAGMEMTFTMNASIKMSDYNKIDKSKLTIPEDVVKNAKAESDDDSLVTDIEKGSSGSDASNALETDNE